VSERKHSPDPEPAPPVEVMGALLPTASPYHVHLGLELAEVRSDRGVVRVPDRRRLRNHLGSVHAGGLFSAGELASSAAVVGALGYEIQNLLVSMRSAQIEYRRLARGALTATGRLAGDRSRVLKQLRADGWVDCPVTVEIADGEGAYVASMTVDLRLRTPTAARRQ
jgi:acyl-coenzyme A thioesterase PaaI-like protein